MKEIVRSCIYELLTIINKIIPKAKKQILLYANAELADSTEALAIYMLEKCDYTLKCYTRRKIQKEEKYQGIEYTNTILQLIWWFLRSKCIIETHTVQIKIRPAKHQYILQIWHGTPIKYMESMTNKNYYKNIASFYTHIAYPSEKYKHEMARIFGAKDEQMVLLGYPRNDLLFCQKHSNFLNTDQFAYVVAWLPTFRNSTALGLSNRFDNAIPIISKDNIGVLDKYLQTHNILLIIKVHPLQDKSEIDICNTTNIKIIYNKDLSKNKEPLYSLLSQTDALLTDFSSVMFDYLLTDKPIGFCIDDFDEYKSNVGFCCVEDVNDLLAGPIIRNMDELLHFLESICNSNRADTYSLKRKKVREMSNYYLDGDSSKRCVEEIEKHLEA